MTKTKGSAPESFEKSLEALEDLVREEVAEQEV